MSRYQPSISIDTQHSNEYVNIKLLKSFYRANQARAYSAVLL